MIKGLRTSALGMVPKSMKLDVIANNLANVNTTGFKKSDLFVRELIKADISVREKDTTPVEQSIKQSQKIDFSQGIMKETKNPFDVAISGDGFFAIETPDGVRYTRNGNFNLSLEGALVTQEGYKVLGEKGPIYLPNPARSQQKQMNISTKGELSIGNEPVAKLQIVKFQSDSLTEDVKYSGKNLFMTTESYDLEPARDYEIFQGYLEESNVNALEEMIKMIELNTNLQMDQKAIRYQDQTLEQTMELGRI